jgi:hypothetical protein
MDVQSEKLSVIAWLTQLTNPSVLAEVKQIKEKKESDWWNMLSDLQKEDIQAGFDDIQAGRKKPLAQVLEKYR